MSTRAIGKIVAWYLLAGVSAAAAMAVVLLVSQFDWAPPGNIFVPFLGGLLAYLAMLVVAGVMTPNLSAMHRAGGFLLGMPLAIVPLSALAIWMYPA